jgi:hypothetical protein
LGGKCLTYIDTEGHALRRHSVRGPPPFLGLVQFQHLPPFRSIMLQALGNLNQNLLDLVVVRPSSIQRPTSGDAWSSDILKDSPFSLKRFVPEMERFILSLFLI